MKIKDKFNKEQLELIKNNFKDIEKDFDKESLEELEDIIYNKMMDNLDKEQNFTDLASRYEEILDIIVEVENSL
ncbi:MAG: hypothetical protein IJH39_11590 [Clostridia bacterium]|nr:hypothetical protein [Clostridia bacterium]